jgi:hypothetical protein
MMSYPYQISNKSNYYRSAIGYWREQKVLQWSIMSLKRLLR